MSYLPVTKPTEGNQSSQTHKDSNTVEQNTRKTLIDTLINTKIRTWFLNVQVLALSDADFPTKQINRKTVRFATVAQRVLIKILKNRHVHGLLAAAAGLQQRFWLLECLFVQLYGIARSYADRAYAAAALHPPAR